MQIPDNFNFGYACICTELRKKNIFSSRTLRLQTLKTKSIGYVKELAMKNLQDLQKMLEYNVEHDIKFMRISSDIFPFASHSEYKYDLEFAKDILKSIGDYAKSNTIRLTMHPGQYNVLSTKTPSVLVNTISELDHNCEILDMMGLDQDSVMIIHGGGIYGNKILKTLKKIQEIDWF
jgi:UV DNA damage endonuclease